MALATVLLLALSAGVDSVDAKPLTAATGEAELLKKAATPMGVLSEDDYLKQTARLSPASRAKFVPITRKPDRLSPQARFGYNFNLAGRLLSFVLDGDEKKGYTLYLDRNASGDLSDDPPLRFEHKEDGKHSLLYRTTLRDAEGQEDYPVLFELLVGQMPSPDGLPPGLILRRFGWTLRRGLVRAGHQEVAFGLVGRAGLYNEVVFDHNGDGQLDWKVTGSPETYRTADGETYVNLGDTSYEFEIDRFGRTLTLRPLAEKRPPRLIPSPGDLAPDFSFTDLEGQSHRLSDYRGKVVLLDFWVTNCGPCVAAAPKLMEVYEKFHPRGLEIIGIVGDDTAEAVREFIAENKMRWRHTIQEDAEGPIHRLYRFDSWPTYYLIGRDGRIVAHELGDLAFLDGLEKLLDQTGK